jgi:hypothetical protein
MMQAKLSGLQRSRDATPTPHAEADSTEANEHHSPSARLWNRRRRDESTEPRRWHPKADVYAAK